MLLLLARVEEEGTQQTDRREGGGEAVCHGLKLHGESVSDAPGNVMQMLRHK